MPHEQTKHALQTYVALNRKYGQRGCCAYTNRIKSLKFRGVVCTLAQIIRLFMCIIKASPVTYLKSYVTKTIYTLIVSSLLHWSQTFSSNTLDHWELNLHSVCVTNSTKIKASKFYRPKKIIINNNSNY